MSDEEGESLSQITVMSDEGPNLWSQTVILTNNYTCKWNINHFSRCPKDVNIVSPEFQFGLDGTETYWRLELSAVNGTERMLRLRLIRATSTTGLTKTIDYAIYRVNCKGSRINLGKQGVQYHSNLDLANHTWKEFAIDEKDPSFWKTSKDYLRIFCILSANIENVKAPSAEKSECKDIDRVASALSSTVNCEDFSDIRFLVEDKQIFAHKVILAARSPVFAAMFAHGTMKENLESSIVIKDLTYDAVYKMIEYIYTEKVHFDLNSDDGESVAHRLIGEILDAADKYDLEGLKSLCGNALLDNLTTETAAEILVQSDLHHLEMVKLKAINFIKKKSKDVQQTEGWLLMTQKYPQLVIECFVFYHM